MNTYKLANFTQWLIYVPELIALFWPLVETLTELINTLLRTALNNGYIFPFKVWPVKEIWYQNYSRRSDLPHNPQTPQLSEEPVTRRGKPGGESQASYSELLLRHITQWSNHFMLSSSFWGMFPWFTCFLSSDSMRAGFLVSGPTVTSTERERQLGKQLKRHYYFL